MILAEHQTKPAILEGLEDWLFDEALRTGGEFGRQLATWADEVAAITRAITQVGEEE